MANSDGGYMFVRQVHQPSPYQQYNQSRIQTMKEYDWTPIPHRGCIMGHGDVPSPTTIYTDKGIPISVIHRFPSDTSCSVQSSPATAHIQQGSQSLANHRPKFNTFIPHHAGFYSPANLSCGVFVS
ncbi:heat shock factor protein 5-like [Oncorhynchus tshawytscha]|uniref:heat shock factor protein 5-like n=1 Tax=Oncorhynchus tshawytscha TaxID=74940 RepID=UPI000D0A4BED|nr:heat shock factor protein 5-like [Oncorhynchus tshawytscha]